MKTGRSKTSETRRNAWIKREHADLIETTKRHTAISFQATLDDFIEAALKQRRLIRAEEVVDNVAQPSA